MAADGYQQGCIFCRIARGELPASIVHRDDHVIAFLDIAPVNPGHLLVVPIRHAATLGEIAPADGERVFAAAQRMAAALRRSGIRCEGVNLFLADGAVAGQEVFHAHLHVVPRFAGDEVRFSWPRRQLQRDALDAHAAAIRAGGGGTGRP
jgi:diadenosine tetraphosphate (Ap4A) HIT family hydrolase